MINVGDTVIWTDEDLKEHDSIITKIKLNGCINLEYVNVDPKTVVTNASHKSVQNVEYGCYWEEKK